MAEMSVDAPRALHWRPLAVIALTIPLMLLVDYAVSYATVVAMFSGSVPLLVVAVVVAFVLLVGAIVAVSRAFTGKLTILGAAAAAGLLAWAGAFGLVNGILRPLALHEDVLLHVAVCVMSALALGMFLGPLPLRIAGAASIVGLIALLVLPPTPTEVAEVEHARTEAAQVDAARSTWMDSGRFPLVTDLPGWSNVELRATGADASTWVRSDTGAVARIIAQWDTPPPDPLAPCNFIGGPGLEWDRGFDQSPSWCIRSGNQWSRSDGSAVYVFDAGTTTWITAFGGYDAERVGGSTAAAPQDIAALLPSLRTMSREEAARYLLPTFDGMNSPEVQTPGF
ncbi:hypothetical protein NQ152_15515 [Microbacterium sp. zg.B48]|uniref:hypothetical protein n=1 Tax=Microbacterium sp. zg.B48 TaxID=2969408 RepID=UPI00214B41A8|nr:hypothetical protein [Microbacterium sp. zg.B48]MCR2764919.1 hypothetical protein [Microbacterium sp. zg.B48]